MAIERFDKEAAKWDSNPFIHSCAKQAQEALLKHVPQLSRDDAKTTVDVLEIGCGTGVLSFLIAPYVRNIYAVDTSSGMIDALWAKLAAHETIKNITPICTLLETPDDPILQSADAGGQPKRFDVILCHLTLHHIPELEGIFSLMGDLLKPGGMIALTDYEDFGPEASKFHAKFKWDDVCRHGVKKEEAEKVMKEIGYADINVARAFSCQKKLDESYGGGTMEFPFLLVMGKRPGS
ncbi:putative methyltransferase [Rhizodiscina lignyota]|uniref:Methyltransferase n=1 Tax=Rhizodiscina lignyota TaxID=1504668 RepID=A0A9P4I740_9PEZI|nr:putative methyltransferase [Rhizodiscina lignyota]